MKSHVQTSKLRAKIPVHTHEKVTVEIHPSGNPPFEKLLCSELLRIFHNLISFLIYIGPLPWEII